MGELRSGPLRRSLVREGVRLSCLDHPGDGAPVVLIHGLAGSAREWDETAARLGCSRRLLALDTRGHGASERRPVDLSRSAHVADVEACLEQLGLGPVVLAGQSLGGHTAFLVAARRPELVSGLVVLESTPDAIPGLPETIRTWLASWPVPFPTTSAAVEFFGGDTPAARGWVANLEQAADGLRPQFEIDVVVASTQEPAERSVLGRVGARRGADADRARRARPAARRHAPDGGGEGERYRRRDTGSRARRAPRQPGGLGRGAGALPRRPAGRSLTRPARRRQAAQHPGAVRWAAGRSGRCAATDGGTVAWAGGACPVPRPGGTRRCPATRSRT